MIDFPLLPTNVNAFLHSVYHQWKRKIAADFCTNKCTLLKFGMVRQEFVEWLNRDKIILSVVKIWCVGNLSTVSTGTLVVVDKTEYLFFSSRKVDSTYHSRLLSYIDHRRQSFLWRSFGQLKQDRVHRQSFQQFLQIQQSP